jgi:prepilin-type N-terminal cleavage/methylation domain-containing protein
LDKGKKGFTLIELMLVVAILSILAAIAIPKFTDIIDKSRESSTKGTLEALRSAISAYFGETDGIYPPALDGVERTIIIGGIEKRFAFLPTFFPVDKETQRSKSPEEWRPDAWARLQRSVKNNESNEVVVLGQAGVADGKKTRYVVRDRGGWLYIADPDGAIIIADGEEYVLSQGEITINHSAKDLKYGIRYCEY